MIPLSPAPSPAPRGGLGRSLGVSAWGTSGGSAGETGGFPDAFIEPPRFCFRLWTPCPMASAPQFVPKVVALSDLVNKAFLYLEQSLCCLVPHGSPPFIMIEYMLCPMPDCIRRAVSWDCRQRYCRKQTFLIIWSVYGAQDSLFWRNDPTPHPRNKSESPQFLRTYERTCPGWGPVRHSSCIFAGWAFHVTNFAHLVD